MAEACQHSMHMDCKEHHWNTTDRRSGAHSRDLIFDQSDYVALSSPLPKRPSKKKLYITIDSDWDTNTHSFFCFLFAKADCIDICMIRNTTAADSRKPSVIAIWRISIEAANSNSKTSLAQPVTNPRHTLRNVSNNNPITYDMINIYVHQYFSVDW